MCLTKMCDKLSHILDIFLPGTNPVLSINVSYNQLTRVPNLVSISINGLFTTQQDRRGHISGVFNFTTATYVEVSLAGYLVTAINRGFLFFPSSTSISLSLSNNKIAPVTSGILKFNFSSTAFTVSLYLDYNEITTITFGSFHIK